MKLQLLKIDKVIDIDGLKYVDIPPGGVQIRDGKKSLASRWGLMLEMKGGIFKNVTRDISFDVYYGDGIKTTGKETHALISLLAVEGLVENIYKQLEEKNEINFKAISRTKYAHGST